jgi:hypothetical protein
VAVLAASPLAGQPGGDRLVVYGDLTYFYGPGKPRNCILNSVYKRGEPLGFRMTAINPATGKRDRATQLVVHLQYGGKTIDISMRDRQNDQQPEREFWVAKWDGPRGCAARSASLFGDREGSAGPHRRVQAVRGARVADHHRRIG